MYQKNARYIRDTKKKSPSSQFHCLMRETTYKQLYNQLYGDKMEYLGEERYKNERESERAK